MKESEPKDQGPIVLGQYFDPFDDLYFFSEVGIDRQGFQKDRPVHFDGGMPVFFNIEGYSINDKTEAPHLYFPAFTPYYPDLGLVIGRDYSSLAQHQREMLDRAIEAYEEDPELKGDHKVSGSLWINQLLLEISTYIPVNQMDQDSLRNLRLRVEFPQRVRKTRPDDDDSEAQILPGSSYDSEPKIIPHTFTQPQTIRGHNVIFDTFYPSEIPLPAPVPGITRGLPIRIPDPELWGLEMFEGVKMKVFFVGEERRQTGEFIPENEPFSDN